MSGNAGILYYDYLTAFEEDDLIRRQILKYIESLYTYVSEDPILKCSNNLKNEFEYMYYVTSNICSVNCSSSDWRFALNTHRVGIKALVHKFGVIKYIYFTIYAFDRYQFEKGQSFEVLGFNIPDKWNGSFIESGLASNFIFLGTMYGRITMLDKAIVLETKLSSTPIYY